MATRLAANSAALRDANGAGTDEPSQGSDPPEIAGAVLDAVRNNHFWILTHRGYDDLLSRRTDWMLGTEAGPPPAPGFFS